ncbi:MAG: DOPA 4,5-dioxygenase family protein [Bdellovibrionales bacterium]|nr:DOPA 4,5-dioxygenase family protein [Bdellovibrionales bacterium]NQZ18714.1 DOPA 4,5-dioxygenase family protein [Bdellovibrionales bacterium]
MEIKWYHFHIYFEDKDLETLHPILEKLKEVQGLRIGHAHRRPVGPHPVGSCQVTVPSHLFEPTLQWFMRERNGLSLFIHPVSGDDYSDHTDHVVWLGKPYKLNIEFFEKRISV